MRRRLTLFSIIVAALMLQLSAHAARERAVRYGLRDGYANSYREEFEAGHADDSRQNGASTGESAVALGETVTL